MDWMKTRRAAWRALSTLAFTFLIGGAASPASAANVAKIVNSGPDAEKLVVAVLADGYTTDEMDRFADDAKRLVVDGLFMQDFFHANSSAFNVYRVDLPSNESGVSQRVYDETGTPSDASDDTIISTTMRDTALRYIYSGSWAHCWMEASADTGALLQDALEAHLPNYDYVLILLNEDGFGGCAGGNRMVATRSSGWSVVAHELGHGLGGLYDEYSKEGTEWSGSTLNTKNCSTVLDRDKVVWHDLIEDTTAIPTVYATGTDPNRTVGMFEGCKTVRSGIYRPVHNCRMNGNSPPFCPVCDRIMKQAVQPYLDGPEDNTLAASYPGALCRAVDSEALRLLSSGELSNAGSEAAQIDCLFRRTFDGTTATLYAVAAAWVTDQHPTEDVCCTLYSKNPGGAKRQGETACSSGAHGSYQILSLNFPKLYDPYSWSHFYLSCRIPGTSDSSRSFIRTFRITQQNF